MKFDFIVVGATGMQGRIVTRDLLESGYSVLLCGRDESRVEHILNRHKKKTAFQYVDLQDLDNTAKIIKGSGAKVLVNAAEGDWNLNALLASIKAGVDSIDLGSDIPMLKKQLALGKTLKQQGLTHITGCGSVPGIGNVMLNYADGKFDTIDTVDVGFAWDSNIKKFFVPFSMESILEEFTMNAPYLHNNKTIRIKPTDSIVRVFHRAVGRESQFNVGHHPETYTFHQFCKKKGVKNIEFFAGFPDHSMRVIQALVDLGFASKKPVHFKGMDIFPDEFLTEMLKSLKMPKGYTETENLWVLIKGKQKGKNKRVLMEALVLPLKGWEEAGCNIDTGMPASIMAQMLLRKQITKHGAYSPEDIVPPAAFFKELRKRKMAVFENGKVIN